MPDTDPIYSDSENQSLRKINALTASLTADVADGVLSNVRDGSGNAITSTVAGSTRRLDVMLSSGGTINSASPANANLVGGTDGTNLRAFSVDTSGKLNANVTGHPTSLGQTTMSASLPVTLASDQSSVPVTSTPASALLTSYSVAGVLAVNTVLATLDCQKYRSVSIQCVSMGTTGVVTPEWSNDNSTWVAATIVTQAGATATTFSAAGLWVVPVQARYLRLRLSTATTAGTTTLSIYQFDDSRQFWFAAQSVNLSSGVNLTADVGVGYRTTTTNSASVVNVASPATPASTTVKGSAGRLLGFHLHNSNASPRYVKLFNATSITLGTTAATFEVAVPGNGVASINLEGGIG